MNLKTREIQHLFLSPNSHKIQGIGIVFYQINCPEDSWNLLENIKQILIFIVTTSLGLDSILIESKPNIQINWTEAFRIQIHEELIQWLPTKLPQAVNPAELVHTVQCLTGNRDWIWWDAEIFSDTEIRLQLEIYGWPVSGLEALKWLFSQWGAILQELQQSP